MVELECKQTLAHVAIPKRTTVPGVDEIAGRRGSYRYCYIPLCHHLTQVPAGGNAMG